MRPVLRTVTYLARAVSAVEKTDGESNRAAQDMLQEKNDHAQMRTSMLFKT